MTINWTGWFITNTSRSNVYYNDANSQYTITNGTITTTTTTITSASYNSITYNTYDNIQIKDGFNASWFQCVRFKSATSTIIDAYIFMPTTNFTTKTGIATINQPNCDIYRFSYQSGNKVLFNISNECWIIDISDIPLSTTYPGVHKTTTSGSPSFVRAGMNFTFSNPMTAKTDAASVYMTVSGSGAYGTLKYFAPVITSSACFIKGTPVATDQGIVPIDELVPSVNTIRGMRIVDILKTHLKQTSMFQFEPNALFPNVPNQQTTMSPNHRVFYKGHMRKACDFENFPNVNKLEYTGEILYNVVLETHDAMVVNNMVVETLGPLVYAQCMQQQGRQVIYRLTDSTNACQ